MDDGVIDIGKYLGEPPGPRSHAAFSVWGGDGERSRLALPVWRAIQVTGGDWGGVIYQPRKGSQESVEPFFVLDLKEDPARTEVLSGPLASLRKKGVPAVLSNQGGEIVVFLGEDEERSWFLKIQGTAVGLDVAVKAKETLLFLAGECSGLLFFRELSTLFPSSASTL